jgi:hypothetical protein
MEPIGSLFPQNMPVQPKNTNTSSAPPESDECPQEILDIMDQAVEILGKKHHHNAGNTSGVNQEPDVHQDAIDPSEAEFVNKALNIEGKKYPDVSTAIQLNKNKIQVMDQGVVTKVHPQDNHGNKHQLFDLKLKSGEVVRIAHNISMAPEIPDLKPGLALAVKGEYINKNNMSRCLSEILGGGYNFSEIELFASNLPKTDGLIHWTHHSNNPAHEGGGFVVLTKGGHYHDVIR